MGLVVQVVELLRARLAALEGDVRPQGDAGHRDPALGILAHHPFGLVAVEAQACGTPVVAFRCGSAPEIVEDGETGYLVDTVEQAVAEGSLRAAHFLKSRGPGLYGMADVLGL